ncbi:MAG TPA: hypothetical protein DCG28_01150 [Lachnospiraceae bacterium]|nr:hypothetical protein [Lachnospiraceae bacterium]
MYLKIKQLGKKGRRLGTVPFKYEKTPKDIKELIVLTVDIMIDAFIARQNSAAESVYTDEQLSAMAKIGKISFGEIYNEKQPNKEKAEQIALQAYEDGLVRIFINDKEAKDPIELKENDEITFIRLTFLAGRMW